MSKIRTIFILILTLSLCLCLCACDNSTRVNYAYTNSFDVRISQTDDYQTYTPIDESGKEVLFKYGVVFDGILSFIEHYDYLFKALATQGYLVIVPTTTYNNSYLAAYPNVKFFVGGHSVKCGTTLRRANDLENVVGVFMYAPIIDRRILVDADGKPVKDDNGIDIYITDSISALSTPTLILNASNDKIITQNMRDTALASVNQNTLTSYTLTPACHYAFSLISDGALAELTGDGADMSPQEKEDQRHQTIVYTLAFLQGVVLG